jgi:hypothetical protein
MRNILDMLLIVGFVLVDFLFFHDFLKAGEAISAAQYLTGALSIIVIALSLRSLLAATAKRLG